MIKITEKNKQKSEPIVILYTATNCPNCPKAKQVMEEVAKELKWEEGKEYVVKNIDEGDNLTEALTYQVAATPSFVIYKEPTFLGSGQIPSKEQLLKAIKKEQA